MSIHWIKPPSELAKAIDIYGEKVLAAVHAAAQYFGQKCQNDSRRGARWEDRTGNARSGLFYAVDGFAQGTVIGEVDANAKALMTDVTVEEGSNDTLIIVVGHTVFYGKFLETAHGGAYAIIMSTIEGNLPGLGKMLKEILR
jgi:hypothetical protein